MLKSRTIHGALALLLAGALAAGFAQLFALRFEHGDVYSPYSTLRADPLGAKALHDALRELSGVTVRRAFRDVTKLRATQPATLLYLGTPHRALWRQRELEDAEAFAKAGGRLVITFLPIDRAPTAWELGREEQKKRDEAKEDEERAEAAPVPFEEVAKRWGFAFVFGAASKEPRRALRAVGSELEPELMWPTVLRFALIGPEWRAAYECEGKPAVIERAFGAGSIALAADSYFLSNEAMTRERAPRLLAWFIGPAREVIFDEESHGVRESPGIASLVGKYGLQGGVAALFVMAALFVWKSASPLVPPHAAQARADEPVLGKEAGEGFVSVLRRSVAPRELLRICAEEWSKTFDHDGRHPQRAEIEKIVVEEEAKPRRQRDAAGAYRRISRVISQTKSKCKQTN